MTLSPNAVHVLKRRYLLRDARGVVSETPDQLWRRVAHAVAAVEATQAEQDRYEEEFYRLLSSLEFLPNSPTLMNAGTPVGQLSACFVLPVGDSVPEIMQAASDMARIHKSGGGTGFSFSRLRPRGSLVASTGGEASGPLSFMRIFDTVADVIKQGGRRRGANMAILRCDHPDVREFVCAKDRDGEYENFNFSVGLTDDFMRAAAGSGSERELFGLIASHAWQSGEPGVVFMDTINRANPTPHLGSMEATNPCQPAFATVLTREGIRSIGDVDVGDVIWSGRAWTKIVYKECSGEQHVYEYGTSAGVFIGTAGHKVVSNGEKVKADEAETIDTVIGPDEGGAYLDGLRMRDVMDGLVIGDGSVHKASGDLVYLIVGADDGDYFSSATLAPLLLRERPALCSSKAGASSWEVDTTITASELPPTYDRIVPARFFYADGWTVRRFLRGLYSANGSVCGGRVTLKSASKVLVQQVQVMLSAIGIPSYITTNREHDVTFSNGTYTCKESYDLNITTGKRKFAEQIGFIQRYKMEKLAKFCLGQAHQRKTSYEVTSKESLGVVPVYDITVDDPAHTYWTGGLLVGNCGEQPLLPYESCNLGSINPRKMIRDGKVQQAKLARVVRTAVRFLDNVITANRFPLPAIEATTERTRKIGLGVMGFADMLIALGVPYDSDEAVRLAEEVATVIQSESHEASAELAAERGAFPAYAGSTWEQAGRPMRNATTTTIAPTGSISIIAGCSSGIEPLFALAYTRNILDGSKLIETCPAFERAARDGGWWSDELAADVARTGCAGGVEAVPEEARRVFRTAREIAPEWHVKMQSAWQRHTDNAVSKTVNLPSSATVGDVERAYVQAWQSGCKGLTAYRDRSRADQPMAAGERSGA